MKKKYFDVVVIGGGSGAKLAHELSLLGHHCAIIDRDLLGGTCLNHGCIPSKMLIHTAELAKKFQRADLFNLQIKDAHCEFTKLVSRVTKEVTKHSDTMTKEIAKNPKLTFFHNQAAFIDAKNLQVGKTQISANSIFIATGAHPHIPKIAGLKTTPYLTSKEALQLTRLPSHLIILGGGYIAAELGFFFSALGAKVSLLTRSTLLSKEDRDIQKEFTKLFSKNVNVYPHSLPKSVSYQKGQFLVESKRGILKGDQLLVATGLRGTSSELQLKSTKIETDSLGFIQVDQYLQTAEKHIFAFGDAIGPPFFRHKANFEAEYLLKAQFTSEKPYSICYPPIPYAIFSSPQISRIGKAEAELKKEKIPYVTGLCKYSETARGMAILPEGGFVKLLFEEKSQKLVGAHIIGEDAAILCQILSAFITKEACLQEIAHMIYIHPSLPEVIAKAAQRALEYFGEPV